MVTGVQQRHDTRAALPHPATVSAPALGARNGLLTRWRLVKCEIESYVPELKFVRCGRLDSINRGARYPKRGRESIMSAQVS